MMDAKLERILRLCEDNIPEDAISHREQAGTTLSYVDQSYVINRLNAIFGNLGWSSRTLSKTMVFGPVMKVNRYGKELYHVTYEAEVEITLRGIGDDFDHPTHSDVGYGHGKSAGEGDAIESAGKEAVTDALKRAARKFGKSLGLALYDKSGKNIGASLYSEDGSLSVIGELHEAVKTAADLPTLENVGKELAKRVGTLALPAKDVTAVRKAYSEKLKALGGK